MKVTANQRRAACLTSALLAAAVCGAPAVVHAEELPVEDQTQQVVITDTDKQPDAVIPDEPSVEGNDAQGGVDDSGDSNGPESATVPENSTPSSNESSELPAASDDAKSDGNLKSDDDTAPADPDADPDQDADSDPDLDPDTYETEEVESGKTYTISSSLSEDKVADVQGGNVGNSATVQIYDGNGTDAQAWRVTTDTAGYSTIYSGDSNYVLDVANGSAYSGAHVQLYKSNGTLAQKWVLKREGDFYKILSAINQSYVLDLSGANTANGSGLQLYKDNGTAAQLWAFAKTSTKRQRIDEVAAKNNSAIADGTYTLATLNATDKVIDLPGGSTSNGTGTQIYTGNGTDAQVWTISHDDKGYVTITHTASGKVLDVAGGNAQAQTKVQLWSSNGTWAQKWIAVASEDGTSVKLLSALDPTLAIDVKNGSTSNGAGLWLYNDNGTKAQSWVLASASTMCMRLDALAKQYADAVDDGTYGVRSDLSPLLVMDVNGGSASDSAAVQTYSANGSKAQQWIVMHDAAGYLTFINAGSYKALDVQGGQASAGAVLQQYALNGTWAQKWIAVPMGGSFKIISALNENLVLDVTSGSLVNSTRIQLYSDNGSTAQRWSFSKVTKDANVTVSASYASNTITPVDVSFGDVVFCLPAASTADSVTMSFDSDVLVGESSVAVAANTSVSITDLLGALSRGLSHFDVFSTAGKALSRVFLMVSENIASIFVTSDDPVNCGREWIESSGDHSNKASGTLYMVNENGDAIYDGKLSEIKGRGNSSWANTSKKPYQIKLNKKTDLLESGDKSNKAKTWCLITDAFDASSSRNAISYTMAQLLGCASAVEYCYVDFYYDGEYRGTYLLCEKVQVNSGRVDIEDLEEATEDLNDDYDNTPVIEGKNSYGMTIRYGDGLTSPDDVTGGYLIEYEFDSARYDLEKAYFTVNENGTNYVFVCKSPEIWSYDEANYMSCLVQDIFDALNNGGVVPDWRGSSRAGMKTSELVDIDSFARLYWLSEITKNQDTFRYSSTYLYKDSDESGSSKLVFGPAWDFDLSCGNSWLGMGETSGWWTRTADISNILFNDPNVLEAVELTKAETISTFRGHLNDDVLKDQMEGIVASRQMDSLIWGNKNESWIDVCAWLRKRLDWIETN